MKNTLSDLNNYLFETIERLQDDELDEEHLSREIRRAEAVTKVSEVIVRNGELTLKTMQHLNEYGYGAKNNGNNEYFVPVPTMLEPK